MEKLFRELQCPSREGMGEWKEESFGHGECVRVPHRVNISMLQKKTPVSVLYASRYC